MEATKTRVSKKKLQEFINGIAVVEKSKRVDSDVYVSKIDGSYLTHVGLEDDLKHFLKRGITEQIQSSFKGKETANIGFNPKDKKWFGWSHRAIYGFGIGSKCKKGDCGYKASNKEDFKEECLSFWGDSEYSISDEQAVFGRGEDYDGKIVDGVIISYTYGNTVPNKKLRGTLSEHFTPFPKSFGKGEWTAKTIEEAKEMAVDFAESVS
jgi:hypothetical protein